MEYATTAASLLCPAVNHYRMNLPKLGWWINGQIDFEEEFNSYQEIKSDIKAFIEKLECIKEVTNDLVLSYYRKADSEEIDYSDLKNHMEQLIKINQTETSSSFGLLFSTDNMKERSNKFAIVKKCMESCATVVMEPILIKLDGEINCTEASNCDTTVFRFRDEDIDYAIKPTTTTSKKRNLGGVDEFSPIGFYNFDDHRQCCSLWSTHEIAPDVEQEIDGTREEFYIGYAMIVTTNKESVENNDDEDNKRQKSDQ